MMKHLEKLVAEKTELKDEIHVLVLLLILISDEKYTAKVLEDDDVLDFLLGLVGADLIEQKFISKKFADDLPTGGMQMDNKFTRSQSAKLAAGAAACAKQIQDSPILSQCRSPIEDNIRIFSSIFGFSDSENAVLTLIMRLQNSGVMKDALRKVKFYNFKHLCSLIAAFLGASTSDVLDVLNCQSKLRTTGVLQIREKIESDFGVIDNLRVLDVLSDTLCNEVFDEESILKSLVSPVLGSGLSEEDYAHVADDVGNLDALLSDAGRNHSILIYGEPGTGKTQLAELLSGKHAQQAFAVTAVKENDRFLSAPSRIDSFNLAQMLLSVRKERVFLVFDEVEDVFNNREDGSKNFSKAWFNNLLENLNVPTIWLSNSSYIDPAYLRRFSYVMELTHPDEKTKTKLIKKYHPNLKLRKAFMDELTGFDGISIASIRQACDYAEKAGLNGRKAELFIANSVMGKFNASNGFGAISFKTTLSKTRQRRGETDYPFCPDYVNIDENVNSIVRGLRNVGEGRMILFGPPGTGKTSFAYYIARETGKKLLKKDAAELLDCYVGGTEKLIKKAFAEAKKTKSILLLDEADTFLTDRTTHVRSWETSAVNQLLQEMEKFSGILIMSTNLVDRLDPAAARRFDYKIRFNYMTLDQRVRFFNDWLEQYGTQESGEPNEFSERLQQLDRIVPGHFQLLTRRARISGEKFDASTLFQHLKREMDSSQAINPRPIGFIQ